MILTLGDYRFPVQTATISASINAPSALDRYGRPVAPVLRWNIDVETGEEPILDTSAAPRFHCDSLTLSLGRWVELEGQTVPLQAPFSDDLGPRAYSYFWGHEPIPDSVLSLGQRSGASFLLRWQGVCNPYLAEPYEESVAFTLEGHATFTGVTVGMNNEDSPEDARRRLASFLDASDFVQHPPQPATPLFRNFVFSPKEPGY